MAKRTSAIRRFTAATVGSALVVASLSSSLAFAGPEDEPTGEEMVIDAVVARPIGIVTTAVGAAAFLVTLPFSALGGNVDKAANKLVVDPAREAFVRCLGCRHAGRPDRFKGEAGEVQ